MAREHEGEQRADAGRRQRREDGDRMDIALIEDAEDDVDGEQRRENEDGLARQRLAEGLRRARETGADPGRQAHFRFHFGDGVDRLAQRHSGSEIEGERDGRELSLMIDGERRLRLLEMGEGRERHLISRR